MLDLHTHSTASDGTLEPAELVHLAKQIGLAGLALTDHDTVDGLLEAIAAAQSSALELVPGVELSAAAEKGAIHIVGLFVDHSNADLERGLAWARRMRNERNPEIATKLAALGVPVDLERVEAIAGGGVVGRPHFAAAMVERGHVTTAEQAFAKYLGGNGAAYVPKRKLEPVQCIQLIRGAGGVPVLAHPDQTQLKGDALEALVAELTDSGLAGIEVYCPSYNSTTTRAYRDLALKYDLAQSGGSDFHGAAKPAIKLGRGFGSMFVPDALLENLAGIAAAIRKGN
ncbi:MAG: PHP domain-containing protein [Deltaproteobacteria bacterium]|nr:PHP domain-containing protein [Deltaproteobacteria bacterium]